MAPHREGYATKSDGGRTLYRGPDAGDAIQAAIDAAASKGGTVRLLPGRYVYDRTVPTFHPNGTRWVRLYGPRATIVLSASAPRAFDARRRADQDVFRFLWLEGFDVEAAGVGGVNHTIFGNRIDGVPLFQQRVSFENIILRSIRVQNALTSTRSDWDARSGISLEVLHPRGGEAARSFVRNIVIDDVSIHGANNGVLLVGTSHDGRRDPHIVVDNVRIRRTRHDPGIAPERGFAASNFHLGSFASVGYALLSDNHGTLAGDNGIEVDNAAFVMIRGNTMENQANVSYYFTNFRPDFLPENQTIVLMDNWSVMSRPDRFDGYGRGYLVWAGGAERPVGTVLMRRNEYRNALPDFGAFALGAYGSVAGLEVETFSAAYSNTTLQRPVEDWHNVVIIENTAPAARLRMRNVSIDYSLEIPEPAARAGASANPYLFFISGERMLIDLADLRVNVRANGLDRPGAGRVHVLYLGGEPRLPSGRNTIGGRIVGLRLDEFSGDDDPVGLRFGSYLDIDPSLQIVDSDLAALPDTSTHFIFDAGLRNAAAISCVTNNATPGTCPPAPEEQGPRVTATPGLLPAPLSEATPEHNLSPDTSASSNRRPR